MRRVLRLIAVIMLFCPAFAAEPVEELFTLAIEKPGGMAFDGELLWVADRVRLELHGLDPESGEVRATLDAPGPWPTGIAFDGELLWVADRNRERLFGIETDSGLVRREIESPNNPLGLAHDGTHLWVADGKSLHQVTTEDGTTIVSFNAPAWSGEGRAGEQLGLAFAGENLWISDRNRDRLYRVDPATGEVLDLFLGSQSRPVVPCRSGDRRGARSLTGARPAGGRPRFPRRQAPDRRRRWPAR